jgi:hypothetical protein
MQYGWDYLPSYMAFTAMYLGAFWALAKALSKLNLVKPASGKIA